MLLLCVKRENLKCKQEPQGRVGSRGCDTTGGIVFENTAGTGRSPEDGRRVIGGVDRELGMLGLKTAAGSYVPTGGMDGTERELPQSLIRLRKLFTRCLL
jgi:hypothetical protein